MGTANRHARGWRRISLALVFGGAGGAAATFLGCGEQLPLFEDEPPPPAAVPAEGGADAETSQDGQTPPAASCDLLEPPTSPPWVVAIGGGEDQRLNCVAADEQGVIVGGSFGGTAGFVDGHELTSKGKADAFVVALTGDGHWRWGRQLGDSEDQFISALSVRGDTVMAASMFKGMIGLTEDRTVAAYIDSGLDALLIRMSARDGSVNDHFHLMGPGHQGVARIAQPTPSAAIVVGDFTSSFEWPFGASPGPIQSKGSHDGFTAQLFTGDAWMRRYWGGAGDGGTEPSNERPTAVAVSTKSPQFIVVAGFFDKSVASDGLAFSSAGGDDIFLEKLDASGKPVGGAWPKRFGDAATQRDVRVAIAENNDIVVAGHFYSVIDFGGRVLASQGNADIFLARFTSDGALLWANSLGGNGEDILYAMDVDACGNILIAGFFDGTASFGGEKLKSAGGTDGFVAKLLGDGTHVWSYRFGDEQDQKVYGVAASPRTGEVFIGGEYQGRIDFPLTGSSIVSAGGVDSFVAKLPP